MKGRGLMDVNHALEILKEKGYKYTDKREKMLQILNREKRYMTAKEVLEVMKDVYPDLSFDTIYRNLALFEEMGIAMATEWDGERRFRFRCSIPTHHHHFICLSCGKTKEIRACPLDAMWGEPDDFYITDHKFEVYGYCRDCSPNIKKGRELS